MYVWYDRTRKANIGKRGHIYQAATYNDNDGFAGENPSEAPWGDPSQGIDTLVMSFITSIQLMLALQCHLGTR